MWDFVWTLSSSFLFMQPLSGAQTKTSVLLLLSLRVCGCVSVQKHLKLTRFVGWFGKINFWYTRRMLLFSLCAPDVSVQHAMHSFEIFTLVSYEQIVILALLDGDMEKFTFSHFLVLMDFSQFSKKNACFPCDRVLTLWSITFLVILVWFQDRD